MDQAKARQNLGSTVSCVLSSLDSRIGLDRGDNYAAEMCGGSEEGLYLRLIDFCITQLKARE